MYTKSHTLHQLHTPPSTSLIPNTWLTIPFISLHHRDYRNSRYLTTMKFDHVPPRQTSFIPTHTPIQIQHPHNSNPNAIVSNTFIKNLMTARYRLTVTKQRNIYLNIKTLYPYLISEQTTHDGRMCTLLFSGMNDTYTVINVLYEYQRGLDPKQNIVLR